jgi:hypothetical protein
MIPSEIAKREELCMTVTVRFVGSGDSFGSGGRFQTCIVVDGPGIRFAMDFGATSLVALRQQDIKPNSIDVILLSSSSLCARQMAGVMHTAKRRTTIRLNIRGCSITGIPTAHTAFL